ncbi:MAG TPA: type II toxin-antitoxin system VapC family toxin [Rhizomicrobium sp.]
MNLLLDTHLLLWSAGAPDKLPRAARALIEDHDNELFFSAVSMRELSIKAQLGRDDFQVDVRILRRALLDNNYREIPLTSEHAVAILDLPPIHKDPFDRALIAQARCEGLTLLTLDTQVSQYPGPIRQV